MSLVDIAIVLIVIISMLIGLFRGFIREILSLISWAIAFWVGWMYAEQGSIYLKPYIDQPPFQVVVAFAVIFVVILLLSSMISYLLYRLLMATGISGVDRSLGTLFGVIRGIVIVAVLILAARFMDFTTQPWWLDATLTEYFLPVSEMIRSVMPPDIASYFQA